MKCADTRCCCSACGSEALCCRSAADSMSSSTKVSLHVDLRTTTADASLLVPLSRVGGLVWRARCPSLPDCTIQHQCTGCQHWKTAAHMHGKQCRDCYNQEHPPHPAFTAAASTPPPSTSSPLSMFGRPTGCIDQLTTVERAAIVTLHQLGWTGQDIAQTLKCSENTVSLWVARWRDERSVGDAERSGRPRCTSADTDESIILHSNCDRPPYGPGITHTSLQTLGC